jgi:uncharacterized membrane protein
LRAFIGVGRILTVAIVSALLSVAAVTLVKNPSMRRQALTGFAVGVTNLTKSALAGNVLAAAVLGAFLGITAYSARIFMDVWWVVALIALLVALYSLHVPTVHLI